MEEVATMPSNNQEFCLRWNNFHNSLVTAIDGFKNDLDFVDVTISCEGQCLQAHKMLLSACSVLFRDLLKANPCQHPIVIMPTEVKFIDLEKMLRFIYQGEVNVQQENLARFLRTAEMLKIRGLAEDNEKQKVLRSSSPRPPEINEQASTSPKRPRLSSDHQTFNQEQPGTPNDDNSRLSGNDSDSEMLPVKQEMIENKDCDLDGSDEPYITDSYLKETSTASTPVCSQSSASNQQSTGGVPPPPGPLLPSYVPPPQIKPQDGMPMNEEESAQAHGINGIQYSNVQSYNKKRSLQSNGEDEITIKEEPMYYSPEKRDGNSNFSPTSHNQAILLPKFECDTGSQYWNGKSHYKKRRLQSNPVDEITIKEEPVCCSPEKMGDNSNFSPISHNPVVLLPKFESMSSPPKMSPSQSFKSRLNGYKTCPVCQKDITNLKRHMLTQHTSMDRVKCPYCQMLLKNAYSLKSHIAKSHR